MPGIHRGHGAPRLPENVETRSFEQLMRLQADAAIDLCGADRSTWNGEWRSGSGDGIRATWDGTVHYGAEQTRTLREMFANAGRPQDEATLVRYRTAVQQMLRENTRLLSPAGDDHRGAAAVEGRTWARVLDEGMAQAWSADHVDEYIDKLGLERVAPGLKGVTAPPEFPREAAAARGLCEAIGARRNTSADDNLRFLNQRTTTGKLTHVTDPPYTAKCLQWLVPQHSRHVAVTSVERALTNGLDRVDAVRGDTAERVLHGCAQQGAAALQNAVARVDTLRQEYDNPQLLELLSHRGAEAAVAISGADHSSFNGWVGEAGGQISEGVIYGVATWDGSMRLHNDYVVQPLREMYADAGQQHDEQTLSRYRKALSTVLHEHTHLLAPHGQHNGDSAQIANHTWARYGEEGFTNAWTEAKLDDYIRELGIDKVAPGITQVAHQSSYPRYTPAAHAVADGIGRFTGSSEEVLRQVNGETTVGKWGTATNLLYEGSRLPALVPAHDEFHAKLSVEKAMRNGFGWLDENTGRGNVDQVRAMSSLRGSQALQAGLAQIRTLEAQYGSPDARALYQAAMTAHSGLAPPSAGGSGAAAARTARPTTSGRGTERPGGRDV